MKTSRFTGGLFGINHFGKIYEVLPMQLPVVICVPQSPPSLIGPLAVENGTAGQFGLTFRSQSYKTFFFEYSESS
jgi:hypothetical protein